MSGATSPHAGMTRRNFLKTAGVAAGALGLAGAASMTTTNNWLAPTEAHAEGEERVAHVFHKTHCVGPCALSCVVRGERLASVEPNRWSDERRQTICLKAISEIEHVYNEERIQTPLKRVGERGEGIFVQITWDEALSEIQQAVNSAKEQHGPKSVMTFTSGEADMHYPFLLSCLGGQYTPYIGVDTGCDNGFQPAFGDSATSATNEVSDWVNANNLILVGTNFVESAIPDVRWLFEAQENGTRLIVVDPAFSTTASKADQWIPIKPGYSGALLIGMISAILENEWYDEGYIALHTSFPFLLDVDTGLLLRSGNSDAGKCLVWDSATQSAMPFDADGAVPALRGVHEVEGKRVMTVLEKLIQQYQEYSLDWASGKTGIEQDVILDLAKRYALNGPSHIAYGFGGPDKYHNADVFGHALITLMGLTGNIGKKGAGGGYFAAGLLSNMPVLASWDLPIESDLIGPLFSDLDDAVANMKYESNDVRVVFNLGDAMLLRSADRNKQIEWLKSMDFIVTVDPYFVDSVYFSDIVLPASTRFECRDEYGFVYSARNHIMLQEKVIEPLYESKPDFEIDVLVSSLFVDPALFPSSLKELTRYQIEQSTDPTLQGITIEKLIENNGIMKLNVSDDPVVLFEDQVYGTPSGRLEVYYEQMLDWGQELPSFEEPNEVFDGNEKEKTYPLRFSQPRSKYHIHNQFVEAQWIQEVYEPFVELNPEDAEKRGLITGDIVEVFNDRGAFQCAFRSNPAVRPGTCHSYYGIWEKYMAKGSVQSVTNGFLNPRGYEMFAGPVVPFNDTLVEVKKAQVI